MDLTFNAHPAPTHGKHRHTTTFSAEAEAGR